MKQVRKSVLLWYSPSEIYRLVTDIERYPEFLPWCERVEILGRVEQTMTARLHLAYAGLRHSFTTTNLQIPDASVLIGLIDGPFSLLDGYWRFVPLPLATTPAVPAAPTSIAEQPVVPVVTPPPATVPPAAAAAACKIEFEMRYAFSNKVLEAAISPVFDRIANTFVDSFVRRAEQVYGPR